MRLGNRLHQLVLQNWTAGRAQRRVGLHHDTLALAELDQLVLGEKRMELHLIGSRDDLGVGQELFEVGYAPVGDTDSLGLAGSWDLLHQLPGLLGRPVWVNSTSAIWVQWDLLVASLLHGNRPVDEKQVDVVQTELFERFVETRLGVPVESAPNFGGDEELGTWDTGCLDSFSNGFLLTIDPSSV